jgi:hypothetical protein
MMLLSTLLQDHLDGRTWYNNNVLPVQDTINLAEAKDISTVTFSTADRHMEMASIIFRRTETVKEFTARFCKIVQENEVDWNDPDPDFSYPKHFMFARCPPSVKRILGHKKAKDFGSCQELALALEAFIGIPDDVPQFCVSCPDCNRKISCSCNMKLKDQHDTKQRDASRQQFFCSLHHANTTHNYANCNVLNPKKPLESRLGAKPEYNQSQKANATKVVVSPTLVAMYAMEKTRVNSTRLSRESTWPTSCRSPFRRS